jgi:hypothetical protein
LVGAQVRSLIGSEHGWLGGLGFGASALRLQDRDQWLGGRIRPCDRRSCTGFSV